MLLNWNFYSNNVKQLNLAYNALDAVPYTVMYRLRDSLTHLDLSGNKIKIMNPERWQGFRELAYLDLSWNKLSNLSSASFFGLPKLQYISVGGNKIVSWGEFVFANASYFLEHVDLSGTGLETVPKLSELGLKVLNLSHNSIRELREEPFRGVKKVEILDVSHNALQMLNLHLLPPLLNLKHLNISANPIYDLPSKALRFLYKLESLRMHDLPNLGELDAPAILGSLRNLRELHLYSLPALLGWDLPEIFRSLPPLRSLVIDLKSEKLSDQLLALDTRQLQSLQVQASDLSMIYPEFLANLRGYRFQLGIIKTNISELPFNLLDHLRTVTFLDLDLRDNHIKYWRPHATAVQFPIINEHGTVLSRLKLQGNPLDCSCDWKWLRNWLEKLEFLTPPRQMSEIRADLEETRCAQPDLLAGRSILYALDQLNCDTPVPDLHWWNVLLFHASAWLVEFFAE